MTNFGVNWTIFSHFMVILGHFLVILGHFLVILGHFVAIFSGGYKPGQEEFISICGPVFGFSRFSVFKPAGFPVFPGFRFSNPPVFRFFPVFGFQNRRFPVFPGFRFSKPPVSVTRFLGQKLPVFRFRFG